MNKNKISILICAASLAMVLAACQNSTLSSTGTASSADFTTSWAPATADQDLPNSKYAGYKADLNGDGAVGSGESGLTWAGSYDKLITSAKTTTDYTLRYKLMHNAETLLMSTGVIMPLYHYSDLYLMKAGTTGFSITRGGTKMFDKALVGGKSTFTACIASAPDSVDPQYTSSVDGSTYAMHLFEGLYKYEYEGTFPNGSSVVVPGLAKEKATQVANADGTVTYTFKLRDNLKWSNGTAITAADFVRSWKRGASTAVGGSYASYYAYIKGGAKAITEADGASLSEGVEAVDDTTLKVTLVAPVGYFDYLMAFPEFFAVPSNADATGAWCAQSSKTITTDLIGDGPMMIKAFDDSKIEMVPNPNYYDAANVKAKDITFIFSSDSDAMLASYKKGDYDMIDDFTNSALDDLKANYSDQLWIVPNLGTYYVSWNVNATAFKTSILNTEAKRETFRRALSLLVNRDYLCDSILKGGQRPANCFIEKSIYGNLDGSKTWGETSGEAGDGSGYYALGTANYDSNKAKAVSMLKAIGFSYDSGTGKFTDVPSFEYLYNANSGNTLIANYLQEMFKTVGVNMTLTTQEWKTVLANRKKGQYTVSRNGWLMDYPDAMNMLEMWISDTANDNNDVQLGRDFVNA